MLVHLTYIYTIMIIQELKADQFKSIIYMTTFHPPPPPPYPQILPPVFPLYSRYVQNVKAMMNSSAGELIVIIATFSWTKDM